MIKNNATVKIRMLCFSHSFKKIPDSQYQLEHRGCLFNIKARFKEQVKKARQDF